MACAYSWLDFALSKLSKDEALYITALDYISFVAYKLQDLPKAIAFSEQLLAKDPNNTRVALNLEYYTTAQGRNRNIEAGNSATRTSGTGGSSSSGDAAALGDAKAVRHDRENILQHSERDMDRFRRLCRGEQLYVPPKPLYCEYQTYNRPELLLKPIKVEHLHHGRQRLRVRLGFVCLHASVWCA